MGYLERNSETLKTAYPGVQKTIDKAGKETNISGKGRHDPCVVPRAVPIVESMAALVILDMILINNSKNL